VKKLPEGLGRVALASSSTLLGSFLVVLTQIEAIKSKLQGDATYLAASLAVAAAIGVAVGAGAQSLQRLLHGICCIALLVVILPVYLVFNLCVRAFRLVRLMEREAAALAIRNLDGAIVSLTSHLRMPDLPRPIASENQLNSQPPASIPAPRVSGQVTNADEGQKLASGDDSREA
jgi:hypothetical protein